MKLDKETKSYLKDERKEFESKNPMTEKERKLLRQWVSEGNSVYSNPSNLYDDHGRQMDYLTACRAEKAYREATKPAPTDSEKLINRLQKELFHLWMFISKEDLYEDAVEYLQTNSGELYPFEMLF